MEVLVVEDEQAIQEVEVAYLKRAGYRTLEASDGLEALSKFQQHGADLAIIDVNIPKLNGLELCRRIRHVSMIPIIIVTALESDDDELLGLTAGADDYVKKPFNPAVLIARVDTLLRRHGNKRLVYHGVTIDPQRMLVFKSGKPITLTTTQFNLLITLAAQPNIVLTRDQLIEKIYPDPAGHDIYDRTIDAHIKNIRKALGSDIDYIQTVVGQGYRFNAGSL